LNATVAENLKGLFTTEKWHDLFSTLSDTLGFTLSIYAESGEPIFVSEGADPPCKGFRSVSAEFMAQCEAYCHPGIIRTIRSGKPAIFKCYAKIVNFSLPIEYMEEKAVILGQGSFANYEDFREWMSLMNSLDTDPLLIQKPLVFTSPQHTWKVQGFVADAVNRLLKNTQETVTLRRKFETLKTLMSAWGTAPGQHPDGLYRDMLGKLSMLLDIECLAVLTRDRPQERYAARYRLSTDRGNSDALAINEHDIIVRDLLGGRPFVLSTDRVTDEQTGSPNEIAARYFFPIMINKQLEAVLQVDDRALDESDTQIIIGFCRQAALSIENYRLHQDLLKKFNRFSAISELTKAITPIQNEKALLQLILEKAAELLKAEQGSLMVLDQEADVLLLEAKKGIVNGVTDKLRIGRGEGIAGKVIELGEPFLVENLEDDPRIRQKNRNHYKTRSFVSVPLKIEDRIIGVLNLSDKDGGEAFNEEDLKLIQSVAIQAAIVMERNIFYNKNEELKKLTITDELTGLLNRRYLYERLKDELARSERHSHELAILMLDLDGFKECNDCHGHIAGDRSLKYVADILLNTVRSMDVVARYGGDEFMVILPETGEPIALEIAERLRHNVSQKTTVHDAAGPACSLTTSIGIVCYPEHGKTIELLLENVDKALYRAKKKGKNSIEVFL
jgi:diguanylate cyclase (GGDEF)-like protein